MRCSPIYVFFLRALIIFRADKPNYVYFTQEEQYVACKLWTGKVYTGKVTYFFPFTVIRLQDVEEVVTENLGRNFDTKKWLPTSKNSPQKREACRSIGERFSTGTNRFARKICDLRRPNRSLIQRTSGFMYEIPEFSLFRTPSPRASPVPTTPYRAPTSFGNILKLNIGGMVFQTTKATFAKYDGMLKTMLETNAPIEKDELGAIFIDRDPYYFRYILSSMRDGFVEFPNSSKEVKEIQTESQHYQLDGLVALCMMRIDKMEETAKDEENKRENQEKQKAASAKKVLSSIFFKIPRNSKFQNPSPTIRLLSLSSEVHSFVGLCMNEGHTFIPVQNMNPMDIGRPVS
ncbi:Protein CBG06877 [Caenorhabditis briggsae]|uniref:Protein CBG06877 n=1 Tax=Caenorhabditis briggsae TaxID=6238 RepID=A8X397_CAEBR|nr:Protein CBG06877 [Caenorhabditis briggsae]CAP27107.2 Protein CBG06877 [Caenorhabditis briggsae]